MYAPVSGEADTTAEIRACNHRAVLLVASLCALFVLSTTVYCYVYALYLSGTPRGNLWDTFRCVSIDWLAWTLIAPLLASKAVKEDISTRSGIMAIVGLLVAAAITLGAARVTMEYALNGDPLLPTLVYFVPRYLFVSASFIGAGVFYVFRYATALEIDQLKKLQNVPPPTAEYFRSESESGRTFVAFKGTHRIIVRCCDIICITASGNYLELETPQGVYLMRSTMKSIEAQLNCGRFVRVHRSHIVNLEHLEKVSRPQLEAKLINGKAIKIGKKYIHTLPHFASQT